MWPYYKAEMLLSALLHRRSFWDQRNVITDELYCLCTMLFIIKVMIASADHMCTLITTVLFL